MRLAPDRRESGQAPLVSPTRHDRRAWLSFCATGTERALKRRLRSESLRKAYFDATERRWSE